VELTIGIAIVLLVMLAVALLAVTSWEAKRRYGDRYDEITKK